MVTQRIRHRFIASDGTVVVENRDVSLGAGRALNRVSSTDAAPVGHMDPGSRKPLDGVSKLHAAATKGNDITGPVDGDRQPPRPRPEGGRGGWTRRNMTFKSRS